MTKLMELRELKQQEAKQFTQSAMARVAGVSVPTYRRLERNPENFTKAQAERIAEHLGCKPADIFLS